MPEHYTIGQVAKYLGVSPNTIRISWLPAFSDFLSETAVPEPGETRYFTKEDTAILETVAVLRDQDAGLDEIHQELKKGVRLELVKTPPEQASMAQDATTEEKGISVREQRLTAVVAEIRGNLAAVLDERNRLEEKLEETQEKLLDAEKRATAAETEARMLREQQKRPSLWERLRGRE